MQDSVSIWYVAARRLCLVVHIDSQVKTWSYTPSDKNCHLPLLCLQHHFGTILTVFAKFKYYFDFDKLAITLQLSRHEKLCPFPILIEQYLVPQLFWNEKISKQLHSEVLSCFPYQNMICFLSIWQKEEHQQLKNISQANWVVFGQFFL